MQPFNQKMNLSRGIKMQENIEIDQLTKSLIQMKQLTERMARNLEKVNQVIEENINTGSGVWDSEQAALYKGRWETVMKEFPMIIKTFQQQEADLEKFLENMKKVEE